MVLVKWFRVQAVGSWAEGPGREKGDGPAQDQGNRVNSSIRWEQSPRIGYFLPFCRKCQQPRAVFKLLRRQFPSTIFSSTDRRSNR